MRIVPDSNILISAFIWGGLPARLVESAILGNVELYVSQPIVEEILRVLRRKGFNELVIQEALAYIKASRSILVTTQTLRVVLADPDDDKILECAVAATTDVIVTGDKTSTSARQISRNTHSAGTRTDRAIGTA